jgi:glycosyltransferase involved in cell wall biosynthesis
VSPRPAVVFLVHEARRTGPPVYALELVRWLAADTELDLSVVLLDGGPLRDAFARSVPTRMIGDPATPRVLAEADLVYVNTATSIRGLRSTGVRPRRVITHVHELEIGLRHYLSAEDYDLMVDITDRFVVGPEVARANLVESHGFDPATIAAVPYFPPRHEGVAPTGPAPRERLGLDPATRLIGACGSRDWRKAPDLFAQLAWELGRRDLPDPVHFVWVGDPNPSVDHWDAATDLALLGVEDRVDLVGQQPDPLRWIAEFDVFAMTSRDDTFPLVCLEAGSLGVPVVCFESGGIPDLLAASGGGASVAYADVTAMADRVEELLRDEGLRRRRGDALRAHVTSHHAVDRCAGLIAAEIEALLD